MAGKTLVNEETFTHPVEMPLTDRELLAYADELTAVDTKEHEVTTRHDGEKAFFKSEIKALEKQSNTILDRLRTKKEYKQIECYNDFNYFEGIVTVRRVDSDEAVTTRKMTAGEYKANLPFPEPKDDSEEA